MKSTYKRLGDYIEPCDEKNSANEPLELRGISNQKYFQKAKTNTIGVDLSTYRIVRTGQFAFNRATTRNGDKISIALRQEPDCIVSPSYRIFKSKDENVLNSEYLMMWFRRPEFDRYARFKSHGSAHEFFDYDEMCEVELPIPSIEKQRAFVREYNTIVNRIQLNEQLIQKLEETAQTIYKRWFVEFEFPDEEGKPYKSSGGKMVYNEVLDKEIPEGWAIGNLNDVVENFISKRGKSKSIMNLQSRSIEFRFPVISAMNISNGKIVKQDTIPFVNFDEYNEWMNPKLDVDDVILTSEAPLGETYYLAINSELALSQRLFALRTKKDVLSGWHLYLWFNTPFAKQELESRSSGTTVFGIKLSELKKVMILIPEKSIDKRFHKDTKSISEIIEIKNQENQKLAELKELLLSKMTKIEETTEKEVI
jgi:type I restriction enzyme S subunit